MDLAAIPLNITPQEAGRANATLLMPSIFATKDDLYEGSEVFVLGFPGAVGTGFWTKALVRQGAIEPAAKVLELLKEVEKKLSQPNAH